jgi:ribosomal protein S18 acetylase RimI-like enzyme
MQRADLEFLIEITRSLGWTTTSSDIENFLSYEPKGCFVADLKGEVVGSVTTTPYTHFGWIGMVLVKEELRRRGIGSALMWRAIDYLRKKRIATARLEADPPGVPLYEQLSFVKECNSERLYREGPTLPPVDGVRRATEADLRKIRALDMQAFGDDRTRVLARLLRCSEFALVSEEKPAKGMLMARMTAHGALFGPFVAAEPQLAEHLLKAGLSRVIDAPVFVGVPETHENALNLLRRYGFKQRATLSRMYLGSAPRSGDPLLEYGIGASATG